MAARGGIWAVGSLATDGTSLFAATGNTEGVSTWGGGEAVIRFALGPMFSGNNTDYWAATNWQSLDGADLDIGGANPILFDMPGAPVPHLVAQPGKDQNLYLLNRDNLGGIGTELSSAQVANNEMNAAGAAYTTSAGTYVAVRVANGGTGNGCPGGTNGNIAVSKIAAASPPTATLTWCSDQNSLGSPIVTTTDGTNNAIVWSANDHLWAYDGDTGQNLLSTNTMNDLNGNSLPIFNTPIAAGGRIVVAADAHVYVFKP